jgi:hypothetical protein
MDSPPKQFDAVPFFWSQHYDVAINCRKPQQNSSFRSCNPRLSCGAPRPSPRLYKRPGKRRRRPLSESASASAELSAKSRVITSQSISGDQEKKCHLSGLLQGAKDIHTPPHSFLENTYLLESDEFAYAPIEQLILNQLLNLLVRRSK